MHKKDSENIKRQWLLQNEKVCLCRGLPRKIVMAAIKAGALSLPEINRIIGSGSGDCNGERCGPKIEKLLDEYIAATQK